MKKRAANTKAGQTVTAERAARLHRLLSLLGSKPQTRPVLLKKLSLDIRAFYRDLELLRAADIHIPFVDGQYALQDRLNEVLPKLPFPDPHLTLGEAIQLAKGRSTAHKNLRAQVDRIVRVKRK